MVIGSFIFAIGGVLLVLIMLQGFNRATYERGRVKMARELYAFLDHVCAIDREHGEGTWRGMPVTIALNHYSINYTVALPVTGMSYRELLARHGGQALAGRLATLEMEVDDDNRLVGSVPRENGLAESLITVEQRIAVAGEVRALQRYVPGELIKALETARSSREIDDLLELMMAHHAAAPEMADAIELAAQRNPSNERQRELSQLRLDQALTKLANDAPACSSVVRSAHDDGRAARRWANRA